VQILEDSQLMSDLNFYMQSKDHTTASKKHQIGVNAPINEKELQKLLQKGNAKNIPSHLFS